VVDHPEGALADHGAAEAEEVMTLRAARWTRVSSRPQSEDDRNGLPAQNFEIDRAIAEMGWLDSGLGWTAPESGATVHNHPNFRAALDAAGRDYDVLVVAYSSRFGRLTEAALQSLRTLEDHGASLYIADQRLWTRIDGTWTTLARQFVEDQAWRMRHATVIRQAYESRYRRRGIPAARPPMGYAMDWTPNEDAATVRALYQQYSTGLISIQTLASEFNLPADKIKNLLKNKAYLGHSAMRLWDPEQPRLPLWRRNRVWTENHHEAIISQELFDAVTVQRNTRHRAGGPSTATPSMLSRRIFCVCGAALRLDGRDRQGRSRIRHLRPCEAWGKHERRQATYFEAPLRQALSQIRFSDEHIEEIIRTRGTTAAYQPPPSPKFREQRARVTGDLVARRITGIEAERLLVAIDEDEFAYHAHLSRAQRSQISDTVLRGALSDFAAMVRVARS
jgi:DNA invertase Pin-like site-specific DNA recombinase